MKNLVILCTLLMFGCGSSQKLAPDQSNMSTKNVLQIPTIEAPILKVEVSVPSSFYFKGSRSVKVSTNGTDWQTCTAIERKVDSIVCRLNLETYHKNDTRNLLPEFVDEKTIRFSFRVEGRYASDGSASPDQTQIGEPVTLDIEPQSFLYPAATIDRDETVAFQGPSARSGFAFKINRGNYKVVDKSEKWVKLCVVGAKAGKRESLFGWVRSEIAQTYFMRKAQIGNNCR